MDNSATGEWLNRPRLLGYTIRQYYWAFHVISGVILIWGALAYIDNPKIQISALIFGTAITASGVLAIGRFAPDLMEIIVSIIALTMVGGLVNFGRIDAFKEVVSTVGHGLSSGYEEITTQAAGFSMKQQPARQPAPQQQPATTNWWHIAQQKGYKSTGRRLDPKQLAWCASPGRGLTTHEQINCNTTVIHTCVSCTK